MKSVFMALWCFCFMLIAVIGCDQGMNMMKPAVQDVIDSKPEDEPDTTVPVSQPIAEVEQDVEMMDPTVPEPDVEEPPMLVEETPVEPTDMDPVIPEPDVEEPPMLVEETPVEPPDIAEEVPDKICKVGMIIEKGGSCTHPDNGRKFSVDADGRGHFLFITAGTGITLRAANITFVASKRDDGSWIIEDLGD